MPKSIVIVVADDLLDITGDDSLMREFPHIQEFQEHSTTYSNAFVSTPHCGPSRNAFLTGRYAHNIESKNRTGYYRTQNGYYLHISPGVEIGSAQGVTAMEFSQEHS
uniref:Sulfatase N-terminal domain-containing protein n=1 Tax=Mucochytrium quahogii TaxID=96639 RepID=A0A7S2SN32_9STRA|mmetsp:Transcript_11989/g.19517  ORF Transcript_11989/g.19517 Transcript_11989/m.19517 type:complete len:107 (+) Transcript_11989:155-475(+)